MAEMRQGVDIAFDLDTTIAALQQDLSAIPRNDAIALIDAWQQQLQGNDLAEDLGELKQAILDEDGRTIGRLLIDLGTDATETATQLAGTQYSDIGMKVQQLGRMLSQVGNTLFQQASIEQ